MYINVESKKLASAVATWKNAATGTLVHEALVKSFKRIGARLRDRIKANLDNVMLGRRTGNLMRSSFYRVEGQTRLVALFAGVDLMRARYGRIHELGGWTGRGGKTRIKAVHYIRRSREQEQQTINEQLTAAAKDIKSGLLKDGTTS